MTRVVFETIRGASGRGQRLGPRQTVLMAGTSRAESRLVRAMDGVAVSRTTWLIASSD